MSKITSVEELVNKFEEKYRADLPVKIDNSEADFYITQQAKWLRTTLNNRDKEIIEFAQKNKFFDSWGIEVVYLDKIITALTKTKHE